MDLVKTFSSKKFLKLLLGMRLKKLRTSAGLSLKELAQTTGLSHSYLNEIEKGKKYPKMEKISALANGLGVSLDYLLSSHTRRSLRPLTKIFEKDYFSALPLELFGMSEQSVYDLISASPEKFSSLVMTLMELGREYDLSMEDFQKAALRSYQEVNHNYFPHLEDLARDYVKRKKLKLGSMDSRQIKDFMLERLSYKIDETLLLERQETRDIPYLSKPGKKPALLLNPNLSERRTRFILAFEIANHLLRSEKLAPKSAIKGGHDFSEMFTKHQATYLAQALLINENSAAAKLQAFFEAKSFDPLFLKRLCEDYNVGPETMFNRIAQLAPSLFEMKEAFFLRFSSLGDGEGDEQNYKATKELHLSELHNPHGLRGSEHYCRRWITIWLIQKLLKDQKSPDFLFQAQISTMEGGKEEFLCLTMAKRLSESNTEAMSLTLGLKITEKTKNTVNFLKDPSIPKAIVGNTCERCALNCDFRVAEATVHNEKIKKLQKEIAAREILEKV